jgi:hypothetical protein
LVSHRPEYLTADLPVVHFPYFRALPYQFDFIESRAVARASPMVECAMPINSDPGFSSNIFKT